MRIIFFILGILVGLFWILRLIVLPILHLVLKNMDSDTIKCKKCKGIMTSRQSLLYLLPIYFDDEHKENADYYLRNMQRIDNHSQIPKGRRACYLHLFQCQNCTNKKVSIVDFLYSRESELVHGGGIYDYELFQHLFTNDNY